MSDIKIGDIAILKGQKKGRLHLEGGYVIMISQHLAKLSNDNGSFADIPLDDLEPFTPEYMTPLGVHIVRIQEVEHD